MRVEAAGALITGGASGLGEGVARMITEAGGRVAIADLPSSPGAALAQELGDTVAFVPCDVSDATQVERAVATAVDHVGRLDVCVNCAGVSPAHRVVGRDGALYPLDVFRRTIEINLVGLFDVVRHAAGQMASNEPGLDDERGLIVNVSSIAALEGQVGQAAYTASKGAVAALTIQLARDLSRHGIRVMAVAPGMMDTAMLARLDASYRQSLVDLHLFPRRLGTAQEFAGLVRTFMETTLLNGEIVRLDAATRLP
jgi:3-hydroxyacyl-CoA dehydrogenase / 3-hydroxy-2-methylbutyryl-CoA dehydrogenase